jgi:hypothetical protein
LDQVEEEFGSDLLDNEVDEVTGTKTIIEIGIDAKASLAKEMKEKDNDIEGVDSQSSKCTHQANMTGKMGCTLTRLVTAKKFAINFKQQKSDLNAERKKNAQLEQWLCKMEAALATGYIHKQPPNIKNIAPIVAKTVSMAAPPSTQDASLATPPKVKIDLPPTPGDIPANKSSHTMDEVGRWD